MKHNIPIPGEYLSRRVLGTFIVSAILGGLLMANFVNGANYTKNVSSLSPELYNSALSPAGELGGKIIPASCSIGYPSDASDGFVPCPNPTVTVSPTTVTAAPNGSINWSFTSANAETCYMATTMSSPGLGPNWNYAENRSYNYTNWGPYADAAGWVDHTITCYNDTRTLSASGKIRVTTTTSAPTTYTINASAGSGGTISPSGSVSVTQGSNQTFTISQNPGYVRSTVLVDSVNNPSAVTTGTYTFNNVTAPHTISATYVPSALPTYTITASAGSGGTISPSGSVSVTQGSNQTFTISQNPGYVRSTVLVDSVNNPSAVTTGTYTFNNVTAPHTISATYVPAAITNLTSTLAPTLASGVLTQNTNVTFRGTVQNTGTTDITTPFSNNFTYCWGVACSPSPMIGGQIGQAALNSTQSRTDTSASFLLSNSGTLRVQHCVDSLSDITDSDESYADNCKVSNFSVAAASVACTGLPGDASYHPGDNPGVAGESSAFYSATNNARTCEFMCGAGPVADWGYTWFGGVCNRPQITRFEICDDAAGTIGCVSSGTKNVNFNSTIYTHWDSSYTDACFAQTGPFNTGGRTSDYDSNVVATAPGGSQLYTLRCEKDGVAVSADTQTITIKVNLLNPTLTASQSVVKIGSPVTLTWDSNNTPGGVNEGECRLTGGGLVGYNPLPVAGNLETGTTIPINISGRTTFTLYCPTSGTAIKTVDVVPVGGET